MPENVLSFRPPYPDIRTFYSDDGRWWCARTWIPDDDKRRLLTHGKSYSPAELVRLYGLATNRGEPGLPLKPGESMPEAVRYEIEPLSFGGEG